MEQYIKIHSQEERKGVLYIMQGIPGSGKSTLAKHISANVEQHETSWICSADEFFMKNSEYSFDPSMLGSAHSYCYGLASKGMFDGINKVIVDNTNLSEWEYKNYLECAVKMKYDVYIVRVHEELSPEELDVFAKRNTHGVPREAIQRMYDKYVKYLNGIREDEP